MDARDIMCEECALYLKVITMTQGLPPREGAFIKFASKSASALLDGQRAASRDELERYFKSLNWHDAADASRYADLYHWLVRAFLFQQGRNDIPMFTYEDPV